MGREQPNGPPRTAAAQWVAAWTEQKVLALALARLLVTACRDAAYEDMTARQMKGEYGTADLARTVGRTRLHGLSHVPTSGSLHEQTQGHVGRLSAELPWKTNSRSWQHNPGL